MSPALLIRGVLERGDGWVISLVADRLEPLDLRVVHGSRDFRCLRTQRLAPPLQLIPTTTDRAVALESSQPNQAAIGIEGMVAKDATKPYASRSPATGAGSAP